MLLFSYLLDNSFYKNKKLYKNSNKMKNIQCVILFNIFKEFVENNQNHLSYVKIIKNIIHSLYYRAKNLT